MLFNQKTITRLCSNRKISKTQEIAAKKWLSKLQSGALEKETIHYMEFAHTVLRDILNYPEDEIRFEEDNVEFSIKDSRGSRIICFEVKGTSTKDLHAVQPGRKKEHETPIKQLWDYMSKSDPPTPYGIATNYRIFELFDYTRGQSKFHRFDFLSLEEDFSRLREFIGVFSRRSIVEEKFVETLHEESIIEEREFTKEFYKLYHETRLMLLREFMENAGLEHTAGAIHFAQLFLNRLMFILFAEDTGKLPKRLFEEKVLNILKAEHLISDHSKHVSDTVADLFNCLDEGSKTPIKIFGFNGGLFKSPIPPRIFFKDMRKKEYFKEIYLYSKLKKDILLDEYSAEILSKYGEKLNPIIKNFLLMASFDFNTEVNVNILGHIFEQSITDIELIKEGGASRRKKEGIYYTPELITEYMCRTSIYKFLSKHKANNARDLVLEYKDNIQALEDKFNNMTILDPACGSGAFLIKSVDILLELHREVQLFKQDTGLYTAIKKGRKYKKDEGQLTLEKWHEEDEARDIIEKNIFGVDINEESVEITKLSLFLRIARKNRKLIDLSSNIKCGNSIVNRDLIDFYKKIDDSFSEEDARRVIEENNPFEWETEFKTVFDNGGFDVVIGNPPYISNWTLSRSNRTLVEYLNQKYPDYLIGHWDIYLCFIARCMETLLKDKGIHSFILPSSVLKEKYGKKFRKRIIDDYVISEIFDFGEARVFDNVARQSIIYVIGKESKRDNKISIKFNLLEVAKRIPQVFYLQLKNYAIKTNVNPEDIPVFEKINQGSVYLGNLVCVNPGVVAHSKAKSPIKFNKDDVIHTEYKAGFKKYVIGENIRPYYVKYNGHYMDYTSKKDCFHRPKFELLFESDKLIVRRVSGKNNQIVACFDNDQYYSNDSLLHLLTWTDDVVKNQPPDKKWDIVLNNNYNLEYILAIISSELMTYYFSKFLSTDTLQGSYSSVYPEDIRMIPIKEKGNVEQMPLIIEAKNMKSKNVEIEQNLTALLNWLEIQFGITDTADSVCFKEISDDDFFNLVKRNNKRGAINPKIASDIKKYFNEYKIKAIDAAERVSVINNNINELVYDLYDISAEERKMIGDYVNKKSS